ncbi:LysR family transcriptional regulator [Thalassomonas viridans]|uniref:LysR family transcriptional regulator n=1 Tax=Thalassomonas viridans TaxID=137584 RepID=A0AAE9YXS1_9GAMM|nr:LysR family transcriptional regulator [Thalassomonas viridans]WDE02950.1 LysR family transcriptional regulator [Thalassomonas viridans]
MIDISDIHLVKVVTEVGSINRAAEVLHMSQPTLSKKISRLEHKIKMALFDRQSVGMVATEAARFLLREGEGLITQLHIIERQLELMANMVGGQIRIGVGPIVEQLFLPKVLLDFAESNYQFKVLFATESDDVLVNQLKTSQIDLAIGPFLAEEVPEDFVVVLEATEKLVMVVRTGHVIAKQAKVTLEDLKHYRFVSPSMPKKMGDKIKNFKKAGEIKPDIMCENYAMAKTVVANSDYITIGPESLFQTEIDNGTLVKVEFPLEVQWHCNCLAKPETLLMPAVKEVVKLFSQYMSPV